MRIQHRKRVVPTAKKRTDNTTNPSTVVFLFSKNQAHRRLINHGWQVVTSIQTHVPVVMDDADVSCRTPCHEVLRDFGFCFYRASRQWRCRNYNTTSARPELGATPAAQSLQHIMSHHLAVLRLPGSLHLLAKEIHRQLSLQVPRFQGNFTLACPSCFAPQRPRTNSRHCAPLPHKKNSADPSAGLWEQLHC